MPGTMSITVRENLLSRIAKSKSFSSRNAALYGFLYWSLRTILVVLAALVAAGKAIPKLSDAQPYMAVAIAIFTGIDSFLLAGTKWKIHYRYNDAYDFAESEALSLLPDDAIAMTEFRTKLDSIDAAYAKEALS